jgi:magnesium transporter
MSEYEEAYLDIGELTKFIRRQESRAIKALLKRFKPKDFPLIVERLPKEDRLWLVSSLPDEIIKDFIAKLPANIIEEIVKEIDRNRLIKIFSDLPADELSDIIGKLPSRDRKEILATLPHWKMREIGPLLAFSPTTAGGLMTNRIPIFFEGLDVGRVIEEFNINTKFNLYDTNHYIYAVDRNGYLKGIISIKDLLVTPRNKKLSEIVNPPVVTVKPETDQEDVAKIVARYDLLELPVINNENKLLGAVTIDDVIDVLLSESAEDLEKFGGLARRITAPYLTAKIAELVRKRAPWLIFLCILESITANILHVFEGMLSMVIALSFFIPLLVSTGGNTGSQSASFIIRALATGDVLISDVIKILAKESATSLLLGMILSPITFLIGWLIAGEIRIAFLLSIAVIAIVFMASIIGGLLPLLAAKIKVDPPTISGPLIATISDVVGLTLYFVLAIMIFGLAW